MKLKKTFVPFVCTAILLSMPACAVPGAGQSGVSGSAENNVSSAAVSRQGSSTKSSAAVLSSMLVSSSKMGSNESGQNTVGKWTEKASMHTTRYDFSAKTVNGQIYAIGGENQNGFLSSVEAYNLQTDIWKTVQPMSIPRSDTQTIVFDGKIYVFGGYISSSNEPVCADSAERYDPKTNYWETLKSMKQGRVYHRVTVCNGKLYVIGGSEDGTVLPSVESYDPQTEKWTEEASMPVARMHFGVKTIGGKIYVFGGSGPLSALDSVEMYDPSKKQWTEKASMKTPRFSFQTETVNEKIYVIGGIDKAGNLLSSVEEYAPSLNRWTEKSALHTPRSWFQTTVVDGKIYAVGGLKGFYYQSKDFISSLEGYNPRTDQWTEYAPISPIRCMFQTVAADGGIYAIGGEIAEKKGISSVEKYTVIGK